MQGRMPYALNKKITMKNIITYIKRYLLPFIAYLLPLTSYLLFAQDFHEGDTIYLPEVNLFGKERSFGDADAQKRYLLLKSRVKRVYPYAKMAADRLYTMERTMDTMQNKQQRKVYVKRTQRYIEDHFTDELKKLSRSQGRILIKLIHRQCGMTGYELLKTFLGGFKAWTWQLFARVTGASLKSPYDPLHNQEDATIERIIHLLQQHLL